VALGAVLLAATLLWHVAGVPFIAAVCTTAAVTAVLAVLVRLIWRV
jgi:hypothetical protein